MPKITDLPELLDPSDDDVLPIDDSPASDTATKKVTRGNLVKGLAKQTSLDAHTSDTANPHAVTKAQVGLGNVDDTADSAKPVSTAQQSALDGKAALVHTHTANQITDFGVEVSANTDVAANTAAKHTHPNKALLDTYDQTNANLADAVAKKHVHSNQAVLDATTASYTSSKDSKLSSIQDGATANDTDANLKNRANHTGTQSADTLINGTVNHVFTAANGTKLTSIAPGATANSTDAQLRDRSTHTGSQTATTISDFSTAADARITAQKGQTNGLASLDGAGKVPAVQLPSFVDDVLEFANLAAFPASGSAGAIYVALDTARIYRWSGSSYIEVSPSPGSTDAVAEGSTNLYFTNLRAAAAAPVQSVAGKSGAVSLTKSDVGLSNVDDTSDSAKPVSTAQQTALDTKQYKAFLTVGTANADYITDGTADDVQIQAALNAAAVAGGGAVYLKAGIYQIATTVVLKPGVSLIGAGINQTQITIPSTFSGGIMFREQSGTANNIEVSSITFDAGGKSDVGMLHIYQGDNVYVHHNEFKNQGFTSSSKWATRLGNFNDADPAGTQSDNVRFCFNILDTNNCGTFEQLLFVNQANGAVQDNIFRNNANALAYELMLYVNGTGVDCSRNVFESSSANSLGVMESTKVNVHHNTFHHDASFNCVTVINSKQVKIENNLSQNTLAGNTATFVSLFDRALGPDGFTQLVGDTEDLGIKNNSVDGFKYVVGAQIAGTQLGTDYTMEQSGIVIEGNEIRNCVSVPFLLGIDNAANKLKQIYIRNNNVYSWNAGSSGAIQLRGYSSDVSQMSEIYITGNFIAPPSDGPGSGAVRVIGCTVAEISNNKFNGVSTPITTATGGVVTRQFNNLGSTSNQLPGLDAQSNKITNVTNPTAAQDAATKNYVDTAATPDATPTVKGKVKLTNDLGGTADLPTTPTAVHVTGTETIGGAKTFSTNPTITNAAPGLFLTESDQTAPAGVYRIDVSGDAMRFIRSSTVVTSLTSTGVSVTGNVAVSGTVDGVDISVEQTATVHKSGSETIAGVKTFSASPVVPTPTGTTDASPKGYVDTSLATKANISHTHPDTDLSSLTTLNGRYAYKTAVTVGPVGSKADFVCDGVADDVEIQAALDAVVTTGGGTVFIKNGIYDVTHQIAIGSNTYLRMDRAARLTRSSTMTDDHFFTLTNAQNTSIEGGWLYPNIDTNHSPTFTNFGFRIYSSCYNLTFKDILYYDPSVEDFYSMSFIQSGVTSPGDYTYKNILVDGCRMLFPNNPDSGSSFFQGDFFDGVTVVNCTKDGQDTFVWIGHCKNYIVANNTIIGPNMICDINYYATLPTSNILITGNIYRPSTVARSTWLLPELESIKHKPEPILISCILSTILSMLIQVDHSGMVFTCAIRKRRV